MFVLPWGAFSYVGTTDTEFSGEPSEAFADERDIAYLLESGMTPEGDSVGGDMGRVIRNTSQLPEADRKAMAAYLKSLPPVEGPARPERK